MRTCRVVIPILCGLLMTASCTPLPPSAPPAGSGDAAFATLAKEVLEDRYKRHPSQATDLGIHNYDDQLEDFSQNAIRSELDAARVFRGKLDAIDTGTLTSPNA